MPDGLYVLSRASGCIAYHNMGRRHHLRLRIWLECCNLPWLHFRMPWPADSLHRMGNLLGQLRNIFLPLQLRGSHWTLVLFFPPINPKPTKINKLIFLLFHDDSEKKYNINYWYFVNSDVFGCEWVICKKISRMNINGESPHEWPKTSFWPIVLKTFLNESCASSFIHQCDYH